MTPPRGFRLPPAGRALGLRELAALWRDADAPARLRDALRERLGVADVHLFRSGREALRVALCEAARRSGRQEVVLPAYTCFSVAAAAVAAGLRVRLVDVTLCGHIDPAALAQLPLDRAAALVVCNLFGFAEPIPVLAAALRDTGALVVDDAAQALGAEAADGKAGARGDVAILSFGRGKPLSGLGGGALVYPRAAPREAAPAPAPAQRLRSLLHALAYDAALSPRVFGWLAAVPALGIGETPFEPGFEHGAIPREAAALACAVLARFDQDRRDRAAEAEHLAARLSADTRLVPLRPSGGATGCYPRLACLAPDAALRDAAVAALASVGAGVSIMYPSALGQIAALAPHLEGPSEMPGARALAARLLTLPTHGGLRGGHLETALRALSRAGCT
jgi:dTDP-4-amino-4,6-dideoxygalactose transaminase